MGQGLKNEVGPSLGFSKIYSEGFGVLSRLAPTLLPSIREGSGWEKVRPNNELHAIIQTVFQAENIPKLQVTPNPSLFYQTLKGYTSKREILSPHQNQKIKFKKPENILPHLIFNIFVGHLFSQKIIQDSINICF